MENVILIEDRIYRQRNMLGAKLPELEKFHLLKNISGGEPFSDLKNQLEQKNYSIFNNYTTVLLHRSAFEAEVRNGLIDYLKDFPKKLVLYSGGITGSHISRLKNMELMLINVTEFYSDNLLLYLNNSANNLLMLAFGDKWKTSVLIDSIEKLTLYKKFFNNKPLVIVEEDLKLNNTIFENYFSPFSYNTTININDIEFVLNQMKTDLKTTL